MTHMIHDELMRTIMMSRGPSRWNTDSFPICVPCSCMHAGPGGTKLYESRTVTVREQCTRTALYPTHAAAAPQAWVVCK